MNAQGVQRRVWRRATHAVAVFKERMSEQLTLDSMFRTHTNFTPPLARATDPETSHAAAERAMPSASAGRLLALRTLVQHADGLTDFELADLTGWQQTSIGKRRGELVAAGYVEAATYTGPDGDPHYVKRLTPSGAQAIVWRATGGGRAFLKEYTHD